MTHAKISSRFAFGLGVWLTSNAGLAADAEHGASHAGHHPPALSELNWFGLLGHPDDPALGWLFVTFGVFVFLIVKFARPALRSYLETRAHTVEKAIAEARTAKESAEKRARVAEEKLAALAVDLERMREDFTRQGEAEVARMEAMAHAAAERIHKDTEDTIAAESERAKQSLRAEASKLALVLAEERIKVALLPTDGARLVKSLVDDLAV